MMSAYPTSLTVALVPITIFAIVQSLQWLLTIVRLSESDRSSHDHSDLFNKTTAAQNVLKSRQSIAFELAAFGEIFLLLALAMDLAVRRPGILMTITFLSSYLQFLKLRYRSMRNRYTRDVFAKLKHTTQCYTIHSSTCPELIKKITAYVINGIEAMSAL
ncbi:hypothetical protein ACOME3_001083 [Neoechinorhynchus agilis]